MANETEVDVEISKIEHKNESSRSNLYGKSKLGLSFSFEPEKMPLDEDITTDVECWKLTSAYKWKPIRLLLTPTMLAMSNPHVESGGDMLLKDSIPLEEIASVQWRRTIPERLELSSHLKFDSYEGSQVLRQDDAMDETEKLYIIQIRTVPGGHNSGRDYFFRTDAEQEGVNLISLVKSSTLKAMEAKTKRENDKIGKLRVLQQRLRGRYENPWTERVTALIIMLNFAVCIAQAQMNVQPDSPEAQFFDRCDVAFTAVFGFELAVNLASNWFRRFWSNGWCIFDFVVVVISLVALSTPSLPGITQLRLIRVLR